MVNDFKKLLGDKGFRQAVYAFMLIELGVSFFIALIVSRHNVMQIPTAMIGSMIFFAPLVLLIIVVVALFRHKNLPGEKQKRDDL